MEGDWSLASCTPNTAVDLVVRAAGDAVAQALWHQEPCILHGSVLRAQTIVTLYGVQFREFRDGFYHLEITSGTLIFEKPSISLAAFGRVKEVCAGIGGISMGFQLSGGTGVAFLDRTGIACRTLRMNHKNVIEGDLADRSARIQLHTVEASEPALIAAGIPCQGYSRQGDRLGFWDRRSRTLPLVLKGSGMPL